MSATRPARVEFIDSDRPGLPDGDYEIAVTQTLSTDATTIRGENKIPAGNQFTAVRSFSVAGPRFSLDPSVVRSVFPPAGSTGDHGNVLPHILFNRTTLPWERLAQADDDENPRAPALAVAAPVRCRAGTCYPGHHFVCVRKATSPVRRVSQLSNWNRPSIPMIK